MKAKVDNMTASKQAMTANKYAHRIPQRPANLIYDYIFEKL